MPRKVKITSDHDQIRRWVDQRGGWPAMVQRAAAPGEPGELRIGFPDAAREERIEQISWGEFFQKIVEGGFALEYEERDDDGGLSEFHRIISRQETNAMATALRRPTRAAGRRLQRLALEAGEDAEGRLSEEKSNRPKKTVRNIDQGTKTKKKKSRKAA